MITNNLSTLKIHKLTQKQYDRELTAGNIDENALYLTPDNPAGLKTEQGGEIFNDYENNKATAQYSHAGGHDSSASHNASFVHGTGLTTSAENQAVFGIHNNGNTNALFIVGNGLNENAPSSAFEVNKDGSAFISKDLNVLGGITTNGDIFTTSGDIRANGSVHTIGSITSDTEIASLNFKLRGASIDNLFATKNEANTKVSFSESQELTDEQKARARGNIGAATTEEVISTLEGNDMIVDGNLMDGVIYEAGYITLDGTIGVANPNEAEVVSDYIPVFEGAQYNLHCEYDYVYDTLTGWYKNADGVNILPWLGVGFYDTNKVFIKREAVNPNKTAFEIEHTFTVPVGCAYVKATGRSFNAATYTLTQLSVAEPSRLLPIVMREDDGKIVKVIGGKWMAVESNFEAYEKITLSPDIMESGTLWVSGDEIMPDAAVQNVRTKLYEYTELKKGDKIYATSGIEFRLVYKSDIGAAVNKGFTSVGYVSEHVMTVDAPCLFTLRYTDARTLTDGDLETLVNGVTIEKATFNDIFDDTKVSFSEAQTLTDEQKTQACDNIGAQPKMSIYDGSHLITTSFPDNITWQLRDFKKWGQVCTFTIQVFVTTDISCDYGSTIFSLPYKSAQRLWLNNATTFYVSTGGSGISLNGTSLKAGNYILSGMYLTSDVI